MVDLTVRFSDDGKIRRLVKEFPKAEIRALNKTARSARSFVSKEIRQTYRIAKSDLDPNLFIEKASRRRLVASLVAAGRRLAIIKFRAKQTATGVNVEIRRGRRKAVKGAFIARMRSGHVGVMRRRGKKRLPIAELRTIGVDAMMSSREIFSKARRFIEARFRKVFEQEIKFEMLKRGRT